jgi:hypothetical protein
MLKNSNSNKIFLKKERKIMDTGMLLLDYIIKFNMDKQFILLYCIEEDIGSNKYIK